MLLAVFHFAVLFLRPLARAVAWGASWRNRFVSFERAHEELMPYEKNACCFISVLCSHCYCYVLLYVFGLLWLVHFCAIQFGSVVDNWNSWKQVRPKEEKFLCVYYALCPVSDFVLAFLAPRILIEIITLGETFCDNTRTLKYISSFTKNVYLHIRD